MRSAVLLAALQRSLLPITPKPASKASASKDFSESRGESSNNLKKKKLKNRGCKLPLPIPDPEMNFIDIGANLLDPMFSVIHARTRRLQTFVELVFT